MLCWDPCANGIGLDAEEEEEEEEENDGEEEEEEEDLKAMDTDRKVKWYEMPAKEGKQKEEYDKGNKETKERATTGSTMNIYESVCRVFLCFKYGAQLLSSRISNSWLWNEREVAMKERCFQNQQFDRRVKAKSLNICAWLRHIFLSG